MTGKPDAEEDVEARLDSLVTAFWSTVKEFRNSIGRHGGEERLSIHEAGQIVRETLDEIVEIEGLRATRELCRMFLQSKLFSSSAAPYLLKRWGPVASDEFRRLTGLPPGPTKTAVELLIEKIETAPPPKVTGHFHKGGIAIGPLIDSRPGWITLLGRLGDPAAVPFLIELLLKKEERLKHNVATHTWDMRMRAASSLSQIDDPRAIEPLIKVFKSLTPRSSERNSILNILRRFKDDPRVDALSLGL